MTAPHEKTSSVKAGGEPIHCSGEQNAENVLEIHDPLLAEYLSSYVDEVRRRYPPIRLSA